MYAVGREHPVQIAELGTSRRVVEAALDTEVLQGILHRYRALRRWREGGETYDLLRKVFLRVFPIRP